MAQRPSTFSKLYTAVHTTPSTSTTVTCCTVLPPSATVGSKCVERGWISGA
jgi:hypothetical protein